MTKVSQAIRVVAVASLLVGAVGTCPTVRAEEAPAAAELQAADTTRSLLERNQGQAVTLKLSGGGDELTGTVVKVNDKVVQLTRLTGRDFYDAFVPLEKIAAVLVKARTK